MCVLCALKGKNCMHGSQTMNRLWEADSYDIHLFGLCRYKDEAEKRLKRGRGKKTVQMSSRHDSHCRSGSHCSSSKQRRGRAPTSSSHASHRTSSKRSSHRSRSPIRSSRHSAGETRRSRSWSASSARTDYLGERTNHKLSVKQILYSYCLCLPVFFKTYCTT